MVRGGEMIFDVLSIGDQEDNRSVDQVKVQAKSGKSW